MVQVLSWRRTYQCWCSPLTPHQASMHADVIKWEHFPRYWPFVRGIHRSPVNSFHTGQWRGALMFSLIWAWTNGWVNNRDAGDLRRCRAHYDVTVMGIRKLEISDSNFCCATKGENIYLWKMNCIQKNQYVCIHFLSLNWYDVDGFMQERRKSITNALEIRFSWTNTIL